MANKFYNNQIESNGLWHLYDDGKDTCLCGIPVTGKNHKIKIEKRELCWACHSEAHRNP